MTAAELAERLGAHRTGAGWSACCPAHDDRRASLSIGAGDDGRTLVYCHAGCDVGSIVKALGLEAGELFGDAPRGSGRRAARRKRRAPERTRSWPASRSPEDGELVHPALGAPSHVYAIKDGDGRLFGAHCRWDLPSEKTLRWWRDGTWSLGGLPVLAAPLYGIDGEREMTHPVVLVEGEKAAEAVRAAHHAGVATVCGAAVTPDAAVLEPLRGRDVILWPDADEPGRDHMARIAERLRGVACSLRWIAPRPDADCGEDAADLTTETIRAMVANAAAWSESAAAPPAEREPSTDAELIAELAALPRLEYDRRREQMAERLGVRVSALDAEVAAKRAETSGGDDADAGLIGSWAVEPWPAPIAGAELLDELAETYCRYIVLPPHGGETLALWTLFAWSHDAASISPLLVFGSPEKRCGKTTGLLALRYTSPRPLPAANVTAAVLFRAIERWHPTLIIDEVDTFLGEDDELRGIINSGHVRRLAQTIRCVGDEHEPQVFSTWAPKALALIGRLHDTLHDRSIVLSMRRRLPSERVERLRGDADEAFRDLRRHAARWAEDSTEELRGADPALPDGLADRAADNWRPLVAIADLAGGDWPARARTAALALSSEGATDTDSARTLLLGDVADLLAESGGRITSATLAERLATMEEKPWPEWRRGRPITPRQVAALLRPFGVAPRPIRVGGEPAKGYVLADLADPLARYLPPRPSVTRLQPAPDAAESNFSVGYAPEPVTDGKPREPVPSANCNRVTDEKGVHGGFGGIESPADDGEDDQWSA